MNEKRKYYLQNKNCKIEEIYLDNDNQAFETAQSRNRKSGENWKAYDERGNLIYRVIIQG